MIWAGLVLIVLFIFVLIGYINIHFIIKIGLINNQFKIELVFKLWFKDIKNEYDLNFEKILNNIVERKNSQKSREKGIYIIHYYLQHIRIRELKWISHLGLEDAALTGLFSGSLWAIKGFVLAFLGNKNKLSNIKVNIYPNFEKSVFSSQLSCILRIRIVHIILISISLLFAKVRGQYYGFRSKRAV